MFRPMGRVKGFQNASRNAIKSAGCSTVTALSRPSSINVAFDDEVGLPAEALAQAGVGQNDFQFGQTAAKPCRLLLQANSD